VLALCIAAVKPQQHCYPEDVPADFELSSSYVLAWKPAFNPYNCAIASYLLKIYDVADKTEIHFQTSSESVLNYDLSGLDMCKTYAISIAAVTTDLTQGPTISKNIITPIASNANLNIVPVNANVSATNEAQLAWDLVDPKVASCVLNYKVVYSDRNNNQATLQVTDKKVSIPGIVPCKFQTVRINAVVSNNVEGPVRVISVSGKAALPAAPKLNKSSTTSVSSITAWQVPFYNENSCPLHYLTIAGTDFSTQVFNITDTAARLDVEATILNLAPKRKYNATAVLTNSLGNSPPTPFSFETLEK